MEKYFIAWDCGNLLLWLLFAKKPKSADFVEVLPHMVAAIFWPVTLLVMLLVFGINRNNLPKKYYRYHWSVAAVRDVFDYVYNHPDK